MLLLENMDAAITQPGTDATLLCRLDEGEFDHVGSDHPARRCSRAHGGGCE